MFKFMQWCAAGVFVGAALAIVVTATKPPQRPANCDGAIYAWEGAHKAARDMGDTGLLLKLRLIAKQIDEVCNAQN